MDASIKEFRIGADFGRMLIDEITFYASSSFEKLKALPAISPMFVNALCLIFSETFKDDILPKPVIHELITEFISCSNPPPFIYTFAVPAHIDAGATILASLFRWTVFSDLNETKPLSYSKLHLKLLECLTTIDPTAVTKPIIYTKHLEPIIDYIQRTAQVKEPERIQKSLEKFAQLVQVSKVFFYGNIPLFVEKLKQLPSNSLMQLVIMCIK